MGFYELEIVFDISRQHYLNSRHKIHRRKSCQHIRYVSTKGILMTEHYPRRAVPVRKPGLPRNQLTARLSHAECRSTAHGSQCCVRFRRTIIVFSEIIENRTLIHMNIFHQYDMTNQFPEYLTFFVNHPVYS